jgi:hypothetical protein
MTLVVVLLDQLSPIIVSIVDGQPRSATIWSRISDEVRAAIFDLSLEKPELSARALAVRYTDATNYFVSESSAYGLLKA